MLFMLFEYQSITMLCHHDFYVLKQINPFLNNTNLYSKHNSRYKSHHSTANILMKINDDIIKAIDNQKITLLILLGLSAAFDTVYFKKLSDTLIKRFNFIGSGLSWFKSYLKDCTFIIIYLLNFLLNATRQLPRTNCISYLYKLFI